MAERVELKAGRDLDVLIAESLWGVDAEGWPIKAEEWNWWVSDEDGARYPRLPQFSTDIAAAWEVVEKLAPHYIQQAFSRDENGHWEIDWCVSEEAYGLGYRTVVDYSSDYETKSLPLAICLAALNASDFSLAPHKGNR